MPNMVLYLAGVERAIFALRNTEKPIMCHDEPALWPGLRGMRNVGKEMMRSGAALSTIATAAIIGLSVTGLWGVGSHPAQAKSNCRNTGSFNAFLQEFRRYALQQGIRPEIIDRAYRDVYFDRDVIRRDRAQGVFSQTFLQFANRMVERYRVPVGRAKYRKHKALLDRIERRFGVPGPVLVAFWGLETDFGAVMGKGHTLRSLATLAYDCRRPELFREQFLAAMKILQRGDLTVAQMRGPWAGELGQMQFLPSHYVEYGVDFDGDGKVNLLHSKPDVLASSANYLKHLGWRAGEPWLEEVVIPARLPWEKTGLDIKLPRSQWAKWGVRRRNGRPVKADDMPASLLLPMGRNGPAFLAYRNFDVYLEWNQSLVYATTAAYYATRIAGAPRMSPGRGRVDALNVTQIKTLQRLLQRRGHDVGKVDGIIGAKTRAAVKKEQLRLGLPADGYPTTELLARLR